MERDKFDNKTVTFEEHIKEEHNMWHYLCFIVLVKVKDSTEYTGPESYVAEMIKVSGQGSWRQVTLEPSGRLPNCSAVPGASRDDDSDVCSSFIMGQVSGSRTPCVFTMKKPQMGCHLHFKGGNTEAQRDEHMAT